MPNGVNLVLDTMSEVYSLLLPWRTHEFWDYAGHEDIPDSVYVFGRQQFVENTQRIRGLANDPRYVVIFGNSAEGSSTLIHQIQRLGVEDLVFQGKILLISGGEQDSRYQYLHHEHFLTRILDYNENTQAQIYSEDIFARKNKPYKFLFLNGRARPHRKYLWERLRETGLLDVSLWTMLDGRCSNTQHFDLTRGDTQLMTTNTPIRPLPDDYEFSLFRGYKNLASDYPHQNIKHELFQGLWGDVYINPQPYIDTYFSLVTETVYEHPESFRTEKIAKPLAMAHPWIAAANPGFYRDIKNLGFQTFHPIIDESFDHIENHHDRMERIISVVQDLCNQDLNSFIDSVRDICKYNQQHLIEIVPRLRQEFPQRFFQFIEPYITCKI
jgi:hypothetical protein